MDSKEPLELSLQDLSLETLDLEPQEATHDTPAPHKAKAQFKIDTRGKIERRIHGDRRISISFEADRRACEDRRAGPKPWALGTNI
jgi:hypothetical protein